MIDTKTYWNERYATGGNSGYGSYNEQADIKLKTIKENVKSIDTIIDVGCGDFAFSKRLCDMYPKAKYAGYDISDVIVAENQKKYPEFFFDVLQEAYPSVDLVVCIDVIFHFGKQEEQEELLQQLQKSWKKYLVISAVESKNDVSRFGKPLVKVLIEEKDAYLYVWKK